MPYACILLWIVAAFIQGLTHADTCEGYQPVREAVSYHGLFTAGWFGVREKHCSRLEIYDRLRASEQAEPMTIFLSLFDFY